MFTCHIHGKNGLGHRFLSLVADSDFDNLGAATIVNTDALNGQAILQASGPHVVDAGLHGHCIKTR